ncbi:hypothetical protein lerEdw1_001197 [Lerista edwardsae]|nr:hypothetical protein lerEdw1_001197 [Lerista edwardsae]
MSQRLVLLQQMEHLLKDTEAEKTWQVQEADAAHKRNTVLLNARYRNSKKKNYIQESTCFYTLILLISSKVKLHTVLYLFQTLYWAKVEESIPKWEPFFLGRTQAPIGVKAIKPAKHDRSPSKGPIPR